MSRAVVLSAYGAPDVLRPADVEMPEPGPGQIRIRVRAAGVGPTDLDIRAGHLQQAFPLTLPAVLGFEAAGVVDALGPGVTGVEAGDPVAAFLPGLGGYGDYALAATWAVKPDAVGWADAAALPASAEAAVGTLRQTGVTAGDTVLVLGGGGSVGLIATQLAVAAGARVLAVVGARDEQLISDVGAQPVRYDRPLAAQVKTPVDVVLDAAGHGLTDALALIKSPDRAITLADHTSGVRFSAPTPDRAPDALDVTLPLLAAKTLRLRAQREFPRDDAAAAHTELESGRLREKVVLVS
ncbi:alcohol dehydrogenase catalytic domain-containing protein [Cryptosporangium phraense]|uniref:Zinc-binding dehydrogenase n=1 Tax=Cryptosporangium phraense TaxID=2593070 RepID=A0A545AX79_9ACTN|nr:alcohol dehydrogenase catalytic domain-containing protein [Cryptosporangium phraense]TQS45930.1 zinc-binding dehydrogenase [Cryptosporangium phraense]